MPGGTASQTSMVSHRPRASEQNSRVVSTVAQALHHRNPTAETINKAISDEEDVMRTPTLDTKTSDHAPEAPDLLAVSYLRVSTREQAEARQHRGGVFDPRAKRSERAEGPRVEGSDRNGLQEMLAFVAATRVTFCIVHKLDRLARNRTDDVAIHQALLSAGVTLVSATESIDQTPSGMLVHGIMSSIAEFYSRNLATEVTKGLTQKVAQGGTPHARTPRLLERPQDGRQRARGTHGRG